MRLDDRTWNDRGEGSGQIAFEVIIIDDFEREITVEGNIVVSKGGDIEVVLRNVGGERKFNNLLFTDKYKEHISLVKKVVAEKSSVLEAHIQIVNDYTFKKLGCRISEVPEYYETTSVGDFIKSKDQLDNAMEVMKSQGATYNALYHVHPMKYFIESFFNAYERDLKSVHKVINKEVVRDLSPQYLSRLELQKVGDILNEEKLEMLPLKLMNSTITMEETRGTVIPFELFITKHSGAAVKLGIGIANKFFKKKGFPNTIDKFFSAMEDERNSPIVDKSVLAQTHVILRIVLQGMEESLESMSGTFTNLQKTSAKERVVTFPTPSSSDLENCLVYAIMTLEDYKGRPIKQIDHTHFTSKKPKAA